MVVSFETQQVVALAARMLQELYVTSRNLELLAVLRFSHFSAFHP